jgi:hypothetical protein
MSVRIRAFGRIDSTGILGTYYNLSVQQVAFETDID